MDIIVKDKYIIDFYGENKNLDFITMNHILIDILKKLSTNLNETILDNMNSKILSELNELNKEVINNKHELYTKMTDIKKDYLEDIKIVLMNNSLTNSEKINAVLEKNNDSIITKTNLILNDIVPKTQEKYYGQIESTFKNLHTMFSLETHKLIENVNKDDKAIQDFISNIDNQFTKMTSNLQQPIFNFIQSSEERTQNNIQQIKEKLSEQQSSYNSLTGEFQQFFNKYKYNSSEKGNISEKELYMILQEIFPHDEILDCRSKTSACDYRVNRLSKSSILFENKDYIDNVPKSEIEKFEKDLSLQKQHGIFVSQKSPITHKNNFQVDIIDGIIHVYIPKANYNLDKIKIAVDLIDGLSKGLDTINNCKKDDLIHINKEEIDELLESYNEFNKQKTNLINLCKINNKQILDGLEELNNTKIKNLLRKKGLLNSDEDEFKCTMCNNFVGKNRGSLSAHVRGCKFNPENKEMEPIELKIPTTVSETQSTKSSAKKNNKP
jgi:hypothetical protein